MASIMRRFGDSLRDDGLVVAGQKVVSYERTKARWHRPQFPELFVPPGHFYSPIVDTSVLLPN